MRQILAQRHLLPMLLALAAVAGCRTTTSTPLARELGGNDLDTQLEFWHRLNEQPATTHDDAFHALLLYMHGNDPHETYDARVEELRQRRMLPRGFDRQAEESISRGTLGVALVRLLDVKGGLMLRLLGPTPRYAVRELQHLGVYPASTPQQTFTGSEFVGIIGRVEDYQRGNPADVPAAVLPGEIESRDRGSTPAGAD